MSKMIKIIAGSSILLFIVYGLWPKAMIVDAALVKIAPLSVEIQEEGKTRVVDRYVVSAPVEGFARRIELKVGDSVKKDQVLVQIEAQPSKILDSRSRIEARAKINAAEFSVKAAKENADVTRADLDLSKIEYDRKQKLKAKNTISQGELDLATAQVRRDEARYHSAQFSIEVAEYELKAAQAQLQYSEKSLTNPLETNKILILSPISGQVLKVSHESEGIVQFGEPLIELGDLRSLEIAVDVLSQDAVRIKPGDKLLLTYWGGEHPLEGIVRVVEPAGFTKISALGVEEQRVWIISDFVSSKVQQKKLGDGYRVEASFVIWSHPKVLQIPTSSLFRHQGQWAVYSIQRNKAQIQPVKIGQSNGLATQVLKGLKVGETVIIYPDEALSPGKSVKRRVAIAV